MANVKISELPQASVVNDNDIIPIVQNGETMQAEILAITERAKAGIIISITTNTSIFDLDSGLYNLQADLLLDGTGKIQPNTNNNLLLIKKNNATTFQFTLYDIGYITFGLTTNGGGNYVYKRNISEIEETTNKTSEITSASTSTEYPSAEAVYDALIQKEDIANKVTSISDASTDTQYPSAKLLYDQLQAKQAEIDQLYDQIPTATAEGETINVQDSSNLPIKDFAMLGNATQDTSILTYKCVGTETGDYYFVYDSTNYQFTMPTISANDLLTFNTSTKKLYKGTTQITTTTASTGTLITLSSTPNPDYPQDIHVVTGDNTVKVLGKNLLNKPSNYDFKIMQEVFFEPGTYKISMGEVTKGGGNSPVLVVNNANSYTMTTNATFTITQANKWKIQLYSNGWNYSASANVTSNVKNLMIQKGSTATPYEPYTLQTQLLSLGSIELAKIGDYTDRIFKAVQGNSIYDSLDSNTKASLTSGSWYKQNNTAKVLFTGATTENWTYESTYSRFYTSSPIRYDDLFTMMCNRYIRKSSTEAGGFQGHSGHYILYFHKPSEEIDTATEFKEWLGTHNLEVWLTTTPTYTEITDTTLIGQLENVLKMHTNKNVTNAWIEPTGTNAQAGMVLVYRQDEETLFDNMRNAIISLGGNV